jgi:FkbM family methyltransferase
MGGGRLRRQITSTVKATTARMGFDVQRVKSGSSMDAALARLADRWDVTTVVDVGASDGRWSATARRRYPSAAFLLIEAQSIHEPALREYAGRSPSTHIVIAAAGDHAGTVEFDTSDPFGGAASHEKLSGPSAQVPMTTVDVEVARLGLSGPFLVKLDTHGFEREILEGARDTLNDSALVIVEAYNFELRQGVMRFHELCAHMEVRGFRVLDLVDVMRRPRDRVLWQFDLVFARQDRPEFLSSDYGSEEAS